MDRRAITTGALRRLMRAPASPTLLPAGRMVDLPGRGRTFVVDIPGPDGQPEPPTLLLLHSLACTAYLSWYPALDELARHYRVVMLDQRWHGRGIRSSRFRLSDCADDAAALLDVLGIDRCVPVGYSMGGPVAQLMWRRHRDRVAGLVLCATARNYRGKTRERLFFPFLTGGMLALSPYCRSRVDRVATALPEVPLAPAEIPDWALREFRSTSAWAMPAVIKELGRFNSAAWIGDVDVPTAVVVTAKDHTIPVRRQRRLAESIDGATVHEVAGGHSAIVLGAAAFVPALLEACASVTARLTADHGFLTGRQVR